ncbi:MAG: alpha/beta hydrolase [Alphaproteobacteria bacterium]|nr:MAG: alpha/beta hydrolase [Alphaproteobacteria bacterium]
MRSVNASAARIGSNFGRSAILPEWENGMPTRRSVLFGLGIAGGAAAMGAGGIGATYWNDITRIREALRAQPSTVIESRHGALEYAEAGEGPPVLMIHGTGGGFDQGLLFTRRLVDAGYRVVAPSRFGYLRSAFPDDPSSENQADALIDLLDHLGIEQIAVAGGSAGALPAMAVAIRHPDRTAALITIVPAAYAPGRPPARPWSASQTWLAENVLGSDFLFWSAMTTMRDTMLRTLLATDPALVAAASADEQARVAEILRGILPVSARARGLLNDARMAGDPAPMDLASIRAPTLAISLDDDFFLTADAARHIADSVSGARLIVYPEGGHVWVGRDQEMFGAVDGFLRETGYQG